VCSDVPEPLALICDQALEARVDDRYASAALLRHDLEAYLEALPERVDARRLAQLVVVPFAAERWATTRR
jgi:hypothetical protein